MSAQAYQRNVTLFLLLHLVVSAALVLVINIDALGGWLVFSVFGYAVSWMFMPYLLHLFFYLWPESRSSVYIPKLAAAVISVILICGFSLLLDSQFTHLGLQTFVAASAGLIAGFLRAV